MYKSLWASLLFTSSILSAAPRTVVEPSVIWNKSRVKVCWGNAEDLKDATIRESNNIHKALKKGDVLWFSKSDRELVQEIVESEYSEKKVGITFAGWKDCSEMHDEDAIIFGVYESPLSNVKEGQSSIGFNGAPFHGRWVRQNLNTRPFLFLKKIPQEKVKMITSSEELKLVALHEFGHLAGLRHEHMRATIEDKNCVAVNFFNKEVEEASISSMFEGAYDPNSIMNYCYLWALRAKIGLSIDTQRVRNYALKDQSLISSAATFNEDMQVIRIGLSQGDVHTLSCLYRYSEVEKRDKCQIYESFSW